jgi:hypothetical protein
VQAEIESNMAMVLHDWGLYQAGKKSRQLEDATNG